MVTPFFLLGSTLLFWGWQSQLLLFAIPMAILLEGSRWVEWRLALSDKDFNRLADVSSLLEFIVAIYLFSQQSVHGLFTLLNWLPILLFLVMAGQIYSSQGTIKLSSLLVSLRYTEGKKGIPDSPRLDISYPYLLLCLLAASVHYSQTNEFFLGTCVLFAWGLWTRRPPRYSFVTWITLLILAVTLAFAVQLGLNRLQTQVEEFIVNWFQERFWPHDPYRQDTAIGDIGRLKQFDRIVLRVASPQPSLLLREASYNRYYRGTWRTQQTKLVPLVSDREDRRWSFASSQSSAQYQARVTAYLSQGQGMLALPTGVYQVTDAPILSLSRNDFGAVKVDQGPDLLEYTAYFGETTPLDSSPTVQDLQIPTDEQEALLEITHRLNLSQQAPTQILHTLMTFFNQQFHYSLTLTTSDQITPLASFLRDNRSGHCEYFATATVLLLRTAGIPARYAAGYAVQEFSDLEGVYVVRQRHAHAWSLAYIDGHWQDLDTTPAGWSYLEAENASWWTPIADVGSWLMLGLTRWRWRETQTVNQWLLWFILPLGGLLVWRLYSHEKVARSSTSVLPSLKETTEVSAFYRIIEHFTAKGYTRLPGETVSSWLSSLPISESSKGEIMTILMWHQRYRFDPLGITQEEYRLLTQSVEAWLHKSFELSNSNKL
ncbi:MAG: hypothetical protein BWK79_16505 [Beggiatoa sp. IS2]|nr:MAG: hypothetical protein BWK79_16505 [Beggiatoa sp. IS2]